MHLWFVSDTARTRYRFASEWPARYPYSSFGGRPPGPFNIQTQNAPCPRIRHRAGTLRFPILRKFFPSYRQSSTLLSFKSILRHYTPITGTSLVSRESILPPSLPPIPLTTGFQFERILHKPASRRDRSTVALRPAICDLRDRFGNEHSDRCKGSIKGVYFETIP